jgi:hypothetical protein
MSGRQRRRWGGLCAALAAAGWMGSCPAWAESGADPGVAGAKTTTVEALEARAQALGGCREEHAPASTELRQVEAGFIKLLEREPEEQKLLDDLADFYGCWGKVLQSASPAALELIARSADPVHLAWRLHCRAGEVGADLLFAALARRAGDPEVWMEAANYSGNPAWTIVATEESARLLARRQEPALLQTAAAAAEWAIELDIDYGQLDRAAAIFAGLPDAVRAVVESGATGEVNFMLDNANMQGELQDVRLDLALLSIARGDMVGGDRWLAAVRLGTPQGTPPKATAASGTGPDSATAKDSTGAASGESQAQGESAWYRVLEGWRRRSPDDPFDMLTSLVEEGGIQRGRNLVPAAVARRGGYPALEERFLGFELGGFEEMKPPAGERKLAPPGFAAGAVALEAEIGELRSRLEKDLERSTDEASAALGPDPMAATVGRLLQAPLLTTFKEKPLPADFTPQEPAGVPHRGAMVKTQIRLPKELTKRFELVRVERRGRRVVVIAKSLDYGGAAYWVILSSDHGTTWSQPFYGGVELARDYVVYEASNLPLLAGDHLHVEVERQEAKPGTEDPAASTPPAEKPPERTRRGIYLDIPLATLERDSDGDGLTDLAEERLVTDPADRDTDHDGVPDRIDTLPQVASEEAPGPASRALAAMFAAMQWDERFGDDPSLDERTQYWIGDRQIFRALHLRTRIVVLTLSELDLAEQKLGGIFARYIDLFVLDHAGRRGFAIWTSQVMGETYRLELGDSGWKAKSVDSWIF